MSRHIKKILVILLSSAAFTFLFYEASLGLNLIIFECLMGVISFMLFRQKKIRNHVWYLFLILLIISAFAVLISHTAFAIAVNIFLFLQFMTMQLWPDVSKIHLLSLIAPLNIIPALTKGFLAITKIKKPAFLQKWPGLWLTVASLLIIWLFITMYSASNEYFYSIINNMSNFINDCFTRLFNFENADVVLYICAGLLIASALLIRTNLIEKLRVTENPGIMLVRSRKPTLFHNSVSSFLKWYRSGIFLIFILNVLILIFNILDLRHVWFGFEWNGQLLREFIHEGTWTLVFCVALSAVLALMFFNGKIHFFSKNKHLKWLVKIWIAQNIFMIVSVFIRNVRYVGYYNLASLRTGVFIFLIIAAFALIVLLIKINRGRNMFWMLRYVFLGTAVILTLTAAPDWNRVIARYNISHKDSACFHHDYMVMLPHCIDLLLENKKLFDYPYDSSLYHSYTEDAYEGRKVKNYTEIIDIRADGIRYKLNEKDWREWNYADFRELKYLNNH